MEDDDQGGFSITKVDYAPPRAVTHMVTSNNILVMALEGGKLIRLDLRNTSELSDLDVGTTVRRLFLDPTGNHLIISTVEDTQYLNRSWTQTKQLKTLKNTIVTSVGWDLSNNDPMSTGLILCGTASGQIYEMSIEAASASTMLRSLERGWKLLYTFADAETLKTVAGSNGLVPAGPCVLDGLGWFKVPGTKSTTHCVFATSANRIWQFIGGANFEQLFASYLNMPPYGVYHTLPNEGAGTRSVELHFYHKYLEQQTLWPKAIAWFLGPNIHASSSTQHGDSRGGGGPNGRSSDTPIPHGSFHEGAWMANFTFSDLASGVRLHDLPSASGGVLGAATGAGASGASGSSSSSSFDPNSLNVIDSFRHVPFGEWKPTDATSVSMVLTEFHLIVLYHNGWIQFVSRLTNELVFECKCNIGRTQMRGLAHDPKTNITFAYTDSQLFEVHIENESKNVWRQYLGNGQYDLAEQYAKEDWQRDAIWTAAANHYFSQKLYKIAAEIYAKTSRSFEEVTLKFMNESTPSYHHGLASNSSNFGGPGSNAGSTINAATTPALMVYLKEKLKIGHFQSEMQPTVLCTWLTELYLAKLNDLEAQLSLLTGASYSSSSSSTPKSGPSAQALKDAFESLQDEFKSFLHQYEPTLNRPTIMGLITSYGRVEEMLEYARVVKAYDVVVAWLLQSQDWDRALAELRSRRLSSLLYKHAALLLQNFPAATVQVLIEMCRNNDVDPRELLPALMRYQSLRQDSRPKVSYLTGKPLKAEKTAFSEDSQNHAIRFLEYVIHQQGNKDSAVHNLLIAMYAEEDSGDEEDRLLKFVESPVACIDLEYALGLCEKHDHVKAQVAIYSKMGLHEEAVALALKGNFVDLAKSTAEAVEDEELKKRLWLDLASYMIQKDSSLPQNLQSANVAKVMQFIQQSGILKIEDVLPVFPPFVVINDFKEEICRSLKEYNSHINDLVMEIEDATNAAQAIRTDIDKLPNKFGAISSNQTCETCRTPILSKSFYLFPCSHVFHQNCLIDYLKPLIINAQQKQSMITLSDVLLQKRIQLAQRAAMERDRDSAFASAAPTSTTSSFLPSFFDRDGSSSLGPGGALSSLLSGTPLSGLNLPFGRDSPSLPPPGTSASPAPGSGAHHHSSLPPPSSLGPHHSASTPAPLSHGASSADGANHHFDEGLHPNHFAHHGHKHHALPPAATLTTWTEKQLQDELDRFIAAECPLCGDLTIESVPRPLLDAKSSASWDLSNRL